jgi:pyrroline-5-carboxylate reductase
MVLGSGDLLVLAVKPQDAEAACSAVRGSLGKGSLVLSVMAGVPVERLCLWLHHSKISRAMPNLGVGVCQSATAYWVPIELEPTEVSLIEQFLSCIGRSWRVESQELIDAVTAVAGSGPAYICWLLEQMEGVALELGLSEATSRGLVMQTLKATTSYLEHFEHTCSQLRSRVTSPGGTTAAAVNVLDQTGSHDNLRRAIRAAFIRAREMGQ